MSFTLRPYDPTSETDVAHFVSIRNEWFPDHPSTVEIELRGIAIRPARMEPAEFILEVDGEPGGYGICTNMFWAEEPGLVSLHYCLRQRHAGTEAERALFDAVVSAGLARNPPKMSAPCEDRNPSHVALVEAHGFAKEMDQPVSAVDPAGFDVDRFYAARAPLEAEGYRFSTVAELSARDDGWLTKLYELTNEAVSDIPTPDPFTPIPFEEFQKWVSDPVLYDREGAQVAVFDGEYVGVSELKRNKVDPKLGYTGLTGIRRAHRRKGLATALKATALGWAREKGLRHVGTDNAQQNPMYELNLALGFRTMYKVLVYGKRLK